MLGLLIAAALEHTGVTEYTGQFLVRLADEASCVLLAVMGVTVAVSSLMSNTAATALFLPIVLGLSRKLQLSPSKLLMPLAFASIRQFDHIDRHIDQHCGDGLVQRYGMQPISMFELTPVGIALVGIAYMFLVGRHHPRPPRMRGRYALNRSAVPERAAHPAGSSFVGKTLGKPPWGAIMTSPCCASSATASLHRRTPISACAPGGELLVKEHVRTSCA